MSHKHAPFQKAATFQRQLVSSCNFENPISGTIESDYNGLRIDQNSTLNMKNYLYKNQVKFYKLTSPTLALFSI